MKKINIACFRSILPLFISLIAVLVSLLAEGFVTADNVRQECLRLHILAASDSEEDQRVKLLVRDAVLKEGAEIFDGSENAREAEEKIKENKVLLEEIANNVLKENGCTYKAQLTMEKEYFGTRQYEDVRLPAGQYNACKIALGDAEGQNWWCVMFPPLCLPSATADNEEQVYAVFGENEGDFITGKSGYKIKFRIVEIVEEWLYEIKNR